MSEDALIQCVPIAITSDSVDEPGEECFTFTISTVNNIAGLILSPSETAICISDSEGKLQSVNIIKEKQLKCIRKLDICSVDHLD